MERLRSENDKRRSTIAAMCVRDRTTPNTKRKIEKRDGSKRDSLNGREETLHRIGQRILRKKNGLVVIVKEVTRRFV